MKEGLFASPARKLVWKKLIKEKGWKTPHTTYLKGNEVSDEFLQDQYKKSLLPVVIHSHGHYPRKPIYDFTEFADALRAALQENGSAYLEHFVPGELVHVNVLRDFRNKPLYVSPITKKGNDGEHEVISGIDKNLKKEIEEKAEILHELLGLGHISQIDFVHNPKGVHVVDVHAHPELGEGTGMTTSLKHVGANMAEFWRHVVEKAREEFHRKK
jgi:D-alanine-D-alanine ligase-like ATP-grasp enzyme